MWEIRWQCVRGVYVKVKIKCMSRQTLRHTKASNTASTIFAFSAWVPILNVMRLTYSWCLERAISSKGLCFSSEKLHKHFHSHEWLMNLHCGQINFRGDLGHIVPGPVWGKLHQARSMLVQLQPFREACGAKIKTILSTYLVWVESQDSRFLDWKK